MLCSVPFCYPWRNNLFVVTIQQSCCQLCKLLIAKYEDIVLHSQNGTRPIAVLRRLTITDGGGVVVVLCWCIQVRTFTVCTWTEPGGTDAILSSRSHHPRCCTLHCRWSTCTLSTENVAMVTTSMSVRSTGSLVALTWPTSSLCCSRPLVTQITGSCVV